MSSGTSLRVPPLPLLPLLLDLPEVGLEVPAVPLVLVPRGPLVLGQDHLQHGAVKGALQAERALVLVT